MVGGVLLVVTDHIQGSVRLGEMPNQSMVGGVLLVVTHSGDETYGDVKTLGNNVRGHIARGRIVRGRNVGGK
jgi:hypothetical protein